MSIPLVTQLKEKVPTEGKICLCWFVPKYVQRYDFERHADELSRCLKMC